MKKKSDSECLDRLIVALCRDYDRRKRAITASSVGKRVRMEYAYLNARILEGAGEITGGALAEKMITEIGNGTGYAYSDLECLSEATYKRYKKEVKKNIARRLHLCD